MLFSLELEYYAGVSGSYISGCLWKSWPHKFVLAGACGGFWSKQLLEAGSAYEIMLGCSRFNLVSLVNLQGQRLHNLPGQPQCSVVLVVIHGASAKPAPKSLNVLHKFINICL